MEDEKSLLYTQSEGYGSTIHQQVNAFQSSYPGATSCPATRSLYPYIDTTSLPPGATTTYDSNCGEHSQRHSGQIEALNQAEPNLQNTRASFPVLERADSVPGYDDADFTLATHPPPSSFETMHGPPPNRQALINIPVITEEDAREALLYHIFQKCCYGYAPAREMKFLNLQTSYSFHYVLETFTETRSTCWVFEPYDGRPIDGPDMGPAPGPWDIQATCPPLFQDNSLDIEVPHTAIVKPCHHCCGRGNVPCDACLAQGSSLCSSCQGFGQERIFLYGQQNYRPCVWCQGFGRKRCTICNGFAVCSCPVCRSNRNLKCYIKLTVKWKTNFNDYVENKTTLPSNLIKDVHGQMALEEKLPRIWPINNFPDPEIVRMSNVLINSHLTMFPTARVVMQRQSLRIIPVTQVFYSWKTQQGSFFVFGIEHRVHAPDYPQKFGCGCTIL